MGMGQWYHGGIVMHSAANKNLKSNNSNSVVWLRRLKLPLIVLAAPVAVFFVQIIHLLLSEIGSDYFGDSNVGWTPETTSQAKPDATSEEKLLQSCPPIDTKPTREGLVCFQTCAPQANNTLQGMGLSGQEKVNISTPMIPSFGVGEFTKYRVHFPEEGLYLNLTAKLSSVIDLAVQKANEEGKSQINDSSFLHPRPIMERLMRRIVAKLLHSGVLDPSKSIVNTGSWLGDNALPWAAMLERLRPDNPGNIIAIDPSEKYIGDMVDLANVNGIGNICAHTGVLSSNTTRVVANGRGAEHIGVWSDEQLGQGFVNDKKKKRILRAGNWFNAIPLDSLNLPSLSLLHLDVEGHEGEVLEGARSTIVLNRPVIITEGWNVWPNPKDKNDQQVSKILSELGYTNENANTIEEACGLNPTARNRIWWPDEQTKERAMTVIGREFERSFVPWLATELPEL